MTSSAATQSVQGVVLFAPMGPNPAPLSELVWALYRQRQKRVEKAFVVADKHARYFLSMELLDTDAALDQLHSVLGADVLPHQALEIIESKTPVGADLNNDDTPDLSRAYHALLWEGATAAIEEAGDKPVVFGLISGRRRTMTAAQTMIFQLLARPQDHCIDVRVSEPRAEGGSGFFFPEQLHQHIESSAGPFRASDVEVILVDVPAPKLRSLLPTSALETYESALAAGQSAIDSLSPPKLDFDPDTLALTINGIAVALSPAECLWYGTLLRVRQQGEGWIEATDLEPLRQAIADFGVAQHEGAIRSKTIRYLMGEDLPEYDADLAAYDLASLRSRVTSKLRTFCKTHCPHHAHLLVPEKRRQQIDGAAAHFQRVGVRS